AGQSPLEALTERFERRAAVLILDNMEQVIDAAAGVAALLRVCPNLQIVATSRAPLRIAGELEFQAPPLATPLAPRGAAPVGLVAEAAAFPAVALFVDRARAVRPEFALTDANSAAV